MENTYYYLRDHDEGILRDRLLVAYFEYRGTKLSNAGVLLADALQRVRTPDCGQELERIGRALAKGKPAYNFSLQDVNGNVVRLSDFKGKVVFVNFWFTGCVGCAIYYKGTVSKVEEKWKDSKDVVFIAISVDKYKDMWVKSISNGKYTSPQAINLYTNGNGFGDPVIKAFNIPGCPMPLLVDRKGRIFSSSDNELGRSDWDGSEALMETINRALAIPANPR